MEQDIWRILREGGEIGFDTPGHDIFDVAIKACSEKVTRYNNTFMTDEERRSRLSEIINAPVYPTSRIVAPFFCDLGFNIKLGKGVLINYNCTLLDCGEIDIGNNVLIGPGTQIVTAKHPLDHKERRSLATTAHPVTIGDDVWIGAGATILPGITIGDRSVVGAGAVVTKDVPSDVIVVGNPARIMRSL